MDTGLLNCWEIKKCERQQGGKEVNELGECVASKEMMGQLLELYAVVKFKAWLHKRLVFVLPAKFINSIIAQEED